MNIQTVLRGVIPYTENSYSSFAQVLDKAYIELSFWGSRNVYSAGYSASISLQELAEKVKSLAESNLEYSEDERVVGKIIQEKVSTLYDISCDQQKRVGLIRKCVFSVIEFFTDRSSLLYDVISKAEDVFDYCTAKQYKKITQLDPEDKSRAGTFYDNGDLNKKVPVWHYPISKKIQKETTNDI